MDRKTEIIEAAAHIIGNEGIQSFTTKRLAARVGISEAALYRHYRGKDEVIHQVFGHFEQMIGTKIAATVEASSPAKEKIREIFQLHKQIFQEYPELVFLLFSEGSFIDIEGLGPKIKEILARKFALMETIIQAGQNAQEIRSDVEAYELGKMMMGYFRMYLLQLRLDGDMSNLDAYCHNFFVTIDKIL